MHHSAFINCQNFISKYVKGTKLQIVDFGSYDVNGTLKPLFNGHKYTGVDMSSGPNVDIVCQGNHVPLGDACADVIVSSSCFEHDPCFWETFLEMCRLAKPGAYIYINAPSSGTYHGYPGDCWRFYADSWKALESYAVSKGFRVNLVESYIDGKDAEWHDSVGIFQMK